jgi:mono/diheme cytochrome c family protein
MNLPKSLLLIFGACIGFLNGPVSRAQSAGQWTAPREIYDKICQYCHETGVGPKLGGRKLLPSYVAAVARSGRNGMPTFRPSEISDVELLALGKWIQQSKSDLKP